MSDARDAANHVREQLEHARSAQPAEIAIRFRCTRCGADRGEVCRSRRGGPLFARPRYQDIAREHVHHELRVRHAAFAQSSSRVDSLLFDLRHYPARGLQRAWDCGLYRAIHARIWRLPSPASSSTPPSSSTPSPSTPTAEPGDGASRGSGARRPLSAWAQRLLLEIYLRRALGRASWPAGPLEVA